MTATNPKRLTDTRRSSDETLQTPDCVQEQAFQDLLNAIDCHSGRQVGLQVRRALERVRASNPSISSRELTGELWCSMWELKPSSFVGLSTRHSVIALATLYSLRSAPATLERASFSRAEHLALRHARSAIAHAADLPELVRRRWRHLVGLEGGPLDLTLRVVEPDAGGIAHCWDPRLAQTAVYPHEVFDRVDPAYNSAERVAVTIHEEVHLALSTRAQTRAADLSVLALAALELAADTSEATAASLVCSKTLPPPAALTRYLTEGRRATVDVLARLPAGWSTQDALAATVSLSAAAQQSDGSLLAEAQRRLRGRVGRRELEKLLALS